MNYKLFDSDFLYQECWAKIQKYQDSEVLELRLQELHRNMVSDTANLFLYVVLMLASSVASLYVSFPNIAILFLVFLGVLNRIQHAKRQAEVQVLMFYKLNLQQKSKKD